MGGSGAPAHEVLFTYISFLNHGKSADGAIVALRDYMEFSYAFNKEAEKIYSFLREYGSCSS